MAPTVEAEGYPGIHIMAVIFDIHRPEEVAADAVVEFPPHKFWITTYQALFRNQ